MPETNQAGQVAQAAQAAQPTQQTQQAGGASNQQEQADRQPVTFDAWIATQNDSTKKLIDDHVAGLKVVLAEQKQRGAELAKQLKDAAKAAEAGSDAQKKLEAAAGQIELAEKRATFAEEAIKPEINCSNPRAAWLVAVSEQLFDKRGGPDWAAIKAATPELFKVRMPDGNAGAGTATPPPAKGGMNAIIRRAAGRQ